MRILIRGTNWIGDAVMTIPAIRRLRRLFPDATLVLLTPEPTAGIFRLSGLVDEIIPTRSLLGEVRSIVYPRCDVAVIFPNSFRSALTAWLAGARRKFGYATQKRQWLLSDAVMVPDWKDSRHEVFYYLNLVDEVERAFADNSVEVNEPDVTIAIPETERELARQFLKCAGIDATKPIVAVAPGSTNSRAKRWSPDSFAELSDRVQIELNANVILLGSPGDREVSNRVMELAQHKPLDATGQTDITLAAAVLSEVDLLVSNDMGLAHLAPAVGTPTIVIFGPTNPVTTRPFSDLATLVSANVECSPCMLRDCPIDHRCMTRISPDQIFEQTKKLLE